MNKLLTISFILNVFFLKAQTSFDFTVHVVSPSNSITCINPSVDFVVSNHSDPNINCTWVSQTDFYSGSHVNINVPGIYTVTASNASAVSAIKIIHVTTDLTAPISFLSTLSQSINCSGSVTGPINAYSSLTNNVSHHFISPFGGTYIQNSTNASFHPSAPGVYTHLLINTATGCTSSKTFTIVQSGTGLPTFNLASPGNFSLGCASASVVAISIDNAQTTPIAAGPVSYTIIAPFSSSVLPTGNLSNVSQYSLNTPGQYTAVTRDNTSGCDTRVPFTVSQRSITPNLTLLIPNQVLDCKTPQLKLEAISSNAYINYTWYNLQSLSSTQSKTFNVTSNTAIASPTLHSTYTITATGYENLCTTSSVVSIYQNSYKPTVEVVSNSSLTLSCNTPSIVLTNQSTTGIPPSSLFSSTAAVSAIWQTSPSNTLLSSSYVATASIIYTVTALDNNNGCTSNSLIPVLNGKHFPSVNFPSGPTPFCINTLSNTVAVSPILAGPIHKYNYQWIAPGGIMVSGSNSASINASTIGIYTVMVTNTVSGCTTKGELIVRECYTGLFDPSSEQISLQLYPNPTHHSINIDLEVPEKNFHLKIYNVVGQLIKEQELSASKNTIDISQQQNGIYNLVVMKNNHRVYSAKVIKN